MKKFGFLCALLLCACGQDAGQGGQNGSRSASASAVTKSAAPLPDHLPDYPGSVRVEVPNLGAPGTDSRSGNAIAMETSATPAEVVQFYRARFAEAGVPVRADTTTAEGGLMSVGRDGERGAMLTIARRDGRTRISIIRGPPG